MASTNNEPVTVEAGLVQRLTDSAAVVEEAAAVNHKLDVAILER